MSDAIVTAIVGLFGKLPAHGDFIRRGLPAAVATRLDGWLQAELGRAADPQATITAIVPFRLASTAIAAGQLALGALVASRDRIGRAFPLVALRLSPHPSGALPEPMPAAWDDWCGRAETILVAARNAAWTADATQAALETAARATVAALVPAPVFAVPADLEPATLTWRPMLLPRPRDASRTAGLPWQVDFDRLIARPLDS